MAFLLRLRAGWGYVSERLRARETYYEENGASGRGGYVVEKEAELVSARAVPATVIEVSGP